ncbi:MAG: hypothetical protein K2Q06_02845, partial [Parvularculaceae bacterium]|nr:hypothetical protein [Parvularculaceae bacterium]
MRPGLVLAAAAVSASLVSCGPKPGVSVSPAEALRVDSKSPLDIPFRLSGQKSLDVAAFVALFPENQRPTYAAATFDGRSGATVVTDVAFPDPDGAGPRTGWIARRAELYGVDLEATRRISQAPRDKAAAHIAMFRKVRLFDIAPTTEGAPTYTLGALELDGVKARPGALAPAAEETRPPDGAQILDSIIVGGVYAKAMSLRPASNGGSTFALTIPDFRLAGFGGGKLEGVLLKNPEYRITRTKESRAREALAMGPQAAFLFAGPLGDFLAPLDQRVVAASFEWRRLDMSGWVAKSLRGETLGFSDRDQIRLGSIRARDISTYVGAKRALRSTEATAEANSFAGVVPMQVALDSKADLYDFTAYLADSEKAAIDILRKHKLDAVKGKSAASWRWDPDGGPAGLSVSFDADRLADFLFAFDLADAKAAKIDAARAAGARADIFSVAAFKGMKITIADKALLSTLFEVSALRSGRSAGDLRKEAPEQLRALAAATP